MNEHENTIINFKRSMQIRSDGLLLIPVPRELEESMKLVHKMSINISMQFINKKPCIVVEDISSEHEATADGPDTETAE